MAGRGSIGLRAMLLAGAMASVPAVAQDAAPPAAAPVAAAPDADSGEIVVSARFRAESLNRVPIAITALQGPALAEKNLNNLQDISTIVPSVDFRAGASNKDRTVFIRGIGTITTSPGVESSVSTVLDGVVLLRPGQQTLDLGEVERVEVLRGPQGTLFGKNASAGVINIVTKNPTDETYIHAEAGYFEGDEYRLKGTVSGAIKPGKVDFLLSGLIAGYDGNVKNLTDGDEVNGYKRRGVRGKLLFQPTETLKVVASADFLYQHDSVPTGVFASTVRVNFPTGVVVPSTTLPAALAADGIVPSLSNRTIRSSLTSEVRDKNYGGSVQADLELGDFVVTSITAYREWKNDQTQDQDMLAVTRVGLPSGRDHGTVDFNQFSQELRLTSPKGKLIDYVLGAYYLHAKTDEVYRRDVDQLFANGTTKIDFGVANYGVKVDNYALFGEGNINFTPKFRAILGGRVIYDKLSYFHDRVSTATAAVGVPAIQPNHSSSGDTDKTDFSARAGLQYDIAADATAYATYSRGYKGPAYNVFFNMRNFDEPPLKPETSNAYEIGIKGSAFDRRVQATVAGFITKFDNFQANFTDTFLGAPVTKLINAGKVSTRGVEGDITARPVDPLALSFAFARTDAKVDRFTCPPSATSCVNIDGEPLPFSQKWKLHGEATYTIKVSDTLGIELDTDYTWKSATQYQLDERPDSVQPGYGIWNASVALLGKNAGASWQLRGLVKNIANKNYSSFLTPSGAGGGLVRFVPRDARRYFGVNASTTF